ncbi:diacylglycerol O-acyltransferase [Mycobacterium sp. CBMA 234]|uniref:WS/DGAT/MGAT family O-acyltransferase n=1 Tax=Mycolicibacterium sp. CBMA 234 TaxID=1918495 RepID=UPI0012DDE219|nr:wax ester/triacylglycerol synthase family O-acyltransferase [Mycolicibacterium sp. CBMA 234]MUL64582.1 diacylglycerol O-acyltransferase [Mycolicibacterium sp. CBMA 234]
MNRLSGWDAMLMYSETPNVHNHTLKVAVVNTADIRGDYCFVTFRETLSDRMHLLDPMRYRLIVVPWQLHHPMWLDSSAIDVDYHIRRVQVPAPGGRRELDAVIGDIASTPLDRTRPLWQVFFAEGMADDRVAVIGKVHHALADGVASANLLARAMDHPEDHAPGEPAAALTTAPPTKTELLRAAAADHVRQIRRLPQMVIDSAAGIARVRTGAQVRGHDPQMARHFKPPPTFMNHVVSPGRKFASSTLSLAQFKETSKSLGVTINDLVLAMSAGALRNLLLRFDGRADAPILASVPASIDLSPDRIVGNALTIMVVSLPVHIADPLERVRLSSIAATVAKENDRLLGRQLISRWMAYIPPVLAPAAFRWLSGRNAQNKLFNVSVSNVPGPRERGRLAGATVGEFYSVGPVSAGCGLNITVWSYVDQLNISVICDDRTLTDAHVATDSMTEAFAEIRRAAGISAPLADVPTAMRRAAAITD